MNVPSTMHDASPSVEFVPADNKPFFRSYNDRLELPISMAGSVCLHVLLVCTLVFVLFGFMKSTDRKAIPITTLSGDAESGEGAPGVGNPTDRPAPELSNPAIANLPLPKTLPELKTDLTSQFRAETNADIALNDSETAILSLLEDNLRKKMMGIGQPKGEGNGSGVGGIGADSTLARTMRWVMRFQVTDGQDYLRQLSLLKATILIPVPPANREMMIFREYGNQQSPSPNRIATQAEIETLAKQMRFCDVTPKAVQEIGAALKLTFTPHSFFAFFPKELESQLARDEERFRGRKAKDIAETVFQITVRGNDMSIRVIDQTTKSDRHANQ